MFPFCWPSRLIECLYNFKIHCDRYAGLQDELGSGSPQEEGGGNKFLTMFLAAMDPMVSNVVTFGNDSRFWSHVITGVVELCSGLPHIQMSL